MLAALTWDMRERDVPLLVTLRWDGEEFTLRCGLRLVGGTLRGGGTASGASMDGGKDGPLRDSGRPERSGDLSGNEGGGDLLRSLPPTGVGGRRGRVFRRMGVPETEDETDEERVAPAGGRGGSGGNLDDVGAEYAGDLGASSFIFLIKSITLRASALVAACKSVKRSASNVSASA